MINIDDLYIENYCHANCVPLRNIMRLPKEEAFALAQEMAEKNTDTTAFYRFADFENYYPRRMKADSILHTAFKGLGGNPKKEHPLSFVLHGSEYLDKWFGNGVVTKIPLKGIPSEFISFTYGDSMAVLKKNKKIAIMTKEMLAEATRDFNGSIDSYMNEIREEHFYIEVQLWNDEYCKL